MKKLLNLILISSFFSLLSAQIAFCASWTISSYDTNIEVQENSTLLITETIVADFTNEAHQGIIRTFPSKIAKEDGHIEKLRFDLVSIKDETGHSYSYNKSAGLDYFEYKIGTEGLWIQEPTTYIITYKIKNGLSFFDDHNEVYWNTIGAAWEAPILSATSTIKLPQTITINDELDGICYAGSVNSSEQNCTWEQIDIQTIKFETTDSLSPYEGFTIAVYFPLGHTTEPIKTWWLIEDFWPIIIPLIVFILMFLQWRAWGKDKKVHTVVPEYKPPKDLTIIEAAMLLNQKPDMCDISATLINLAIKKFIKIEELEEEKLFGIYKSKDFKFHRLKESEEENLSEFEKLLLKNIFDNKKSTKLSDLKNEFYKHIPKLKQTLEKNAMNKKLFDKKPGTIMKIYITMGVATLMLGFGAIGAIGETIKGTILGFALLISGVIILIFGFYMPKKTTHGQELYEKILGLKLYIKTAEKNRLEFHGKEHHFEELLPYAMIFGLTKHWAKQFEDIYKTPPSWYDSPSWTTGSVFSITSFTQSLDSATNAMRTSMSSSPGGGGSGFGGGGSVGGGGGGGGGGGW